MFQTKQHVHKKSKFSTWFREQVERNTPKNAVVDFFISKCNQDRLLDIAHGSWAGPSIFKNFNPGRDGTGFFKIPGFFGTGLT